MFRQRRFPLAEESYREALASAKDPLGPLPVEKGRLAGCLAAVLCGQGKEAEAEKIFDSSMKAGGSEQNAVAVALVEKVEILARYGHRNAAVSCLRKATKLQPEKEVNWRWLAILLAERNDAVGFRELCKEMLARFGKTSNRSIAIGVAKASLLIPLDGAELEVAGQLTDLALNIGTDNSYERPDACLKSLAQYRLGNFTNAVEWAKKASARRETELTREGLSSDVLLYSKQVQGARNAQALSLLAMASFQLKQLDQALNALAEAEIARKEFPQLDDPDLGAAWPSVLSAHILIREAQALIPPQPGGYIEKESLPTGADGPFRARPTHVGEEQTIMKAEAHSRVPGFRLEGHIRLTDGKPVPAKTRVLLSRDREYWDPSQTEVDDRGCFKFAGVRAGIVSLSARIEGYHLSSGNRSLDLVSGFALKGYIKADKTNLVLEFEPGVSRSPSRGEYVDLSFNPLLGAEVVKGQLTGDVHVLVTAIDAETKEALNAFTVTEGSMDRSFPESVKWVRTRRTQGTNGQADVFLSKGPRTSVVMLEAKGYLGQASGSITTAETNFTFALRKGSAPTGVLLKPDGKSAAGVKVYLADMRNGVYVQDNNLTVVDRMYPGTRSTRTDESGHFAFEGMADDYAVLVLDEAGFAQMTLEQLGHAPEVRLRPWAKVQGKLMIGSRPGAYEDVCLDQAHLPYEFHPRDSPPLSLFLKAQTDESGLFSFERVPPLNLRVYHSPKVCDTKLGPVPMSQDIGFSLKPGEVKTLAIGGKGRPVIGRCVVSGYDGTINWRADVHHLDLIQTPADDMPDVVALSLARSAKLQATESEEEKKRLIDEMQKSREEATAAMGAFYATPKGLDFWFQNRRYVLNFAQDGSFRVEDVPGGRYRLRINLRDVGDGPMRGTSPVIAFVYKEFEIPDSPGERTDEPFDLGKIELQGKKEHQQR